MHRLVLIGCGRWGRHILRDLLSLGAETAVVDPDPAARAHADARGARTFARLEDAPADVEGYVVATPTARHADVVERLLERGLPIFCEKPLCDAPERAREIAKHCPQGNLFVMEKWRHHPGVLALRALAVSGELGAVRGLRTTRVQWGHAHRDVDAIWTLAPHDLSIADTILGHVPAPRVAVAEGDAGEGLLALCGDDPWFAMEISSLRAVTRREIRLVCEAGPAVPEDPLADHVVVARAGEPGVERAIERRPISVEMPLLRELRAFLAYLEGGPEPPCGLEAAVASVQQVATLRRLAGLPA